MWRRGTGTCTDTPVVVLKHLSFCPGKEMCQFCRSPSSFFIHKYLKIEMTLSMFSFAFHLLLFPYYCSYYLCFPLFLIASSLLVFPDVHACVFKFLVSFVQLAPDEPCYVLHPEKTNCSIKLVQGVLCLLPYVSWDWLQHPPAPVTLNRISVSGWMDFSIEFADMIGTPGSVCIKSISSQRLLTA